MSFLHDQQPWILPLDPPLTAKYHYVFIKPKDFKPPHSIKDHIMLVMYTSLPLASTIYQGFVDSITIHEPI